MRKIARIFLLSLCMILVCVAVGCSCNNDEEYIEVNSVRETSLNQTYSPDIKLGEEVTLVSVKLFDESKNEIFLSADYSFVALKLGVFTYVIEYEIEDDLRIYEFSVTVKDIVAPWVVSKPQVPFKIELGLYEDFVTDLKYIETDDDNKESKEFISKKAIAISKDGQEIVASLDGVEKYPFVTKGLYDVKVQISDVSNNIAETFYQLEVEDTVSPVVELKSLYYAWESSGRVYIPTAKISELSNYTVSTIAKKGNEQLTIENNAVQATVGDEIKLTYTVIDENSNQTVANTIVKVLPDGQVMDSADEKVYVVFSSSSAILDSKNGVRVIDSNKNTSLSIEDGVFKNTDVSQYKGLELKLDNKKSSDAVVNVGGSVNGERVVFGKVKLYSKSSEKNSLPVSVDISRFNIHDIDALYFDVTSINDINFVIQDIKFTTDGVAVPIESTVLNVKSCGKQSVAVNKVIEQKANQFNAIVFSASDSEVQFELNFTSGDKFKTPFISLNKGENLVSFIIDALNPTKDFNGNALKAISVYSHDDFDNTLAVKDISFNYVDELKVVADDELNEYYVDYGDVFIVPDIVSCDKNLIKEKNVVSRLDSVNVVMNDQMSLSSADGAESIYYFDYTIVDVFDMTHTFTIKVVSKSNVLSTSFTLDDYWAMDTITVDNFEVTSNVYDLTAEEITIKKYYRFDDSVEWMEMNDNFSSCSVGQIYIRYVVECQGERALYEQNTYIHADGVMFDFEKFSGGEHLGTGTCRHGSYEHGTVGISDEWSISGDYSLKILPGNCNNAGGYKWTEPGADGEYGTGDDLYPYRYLGYTANAITFWAKAEKNVTIRFCPNHTGVWLCQIDIKAGVHQYVVKLSKPIDWYTCILFAISPDDNLWLDDFSFINLDEIKWQSFESSSFTKGDLLTIKKPTYIGNSSCLKDNIQADNVSVMVDMVKPDGSKFSYDLTDMPKGYGVLLDQLGKYTLTYKLVINGHVMSEVEPKIKIEDHVLENVEEIFVRESIEDPSTEDFPWDDPIYIVIPEPVVDPTVEDFPWEK